MPAHGATPRHCRLGRFPMSHRAGTNCDPPACDEATRRHLRGSNLLLFGRLVALATNLLVNVLLVRCLSKSDYGALAYALAIGALGANLLLAGMPRAVSRLAPLHHERGDHGALLGTLLLATSLVGGLGAAVLALSRTVDEALVAEWIADPLALELTLLLIVLAPLQALDHLFENMLAVFAGAGALFLRRCILGPALRLAAVAAVLAASGSVRAVAYAYVFASCVGLALCALLVLRTLREQGLTRRPPPPGLRFRARELLGCGLPLVIADAMAALRVPVVMVLLDLLRDTREIADLNAFLKISGLNLIVLQSMRQLFVPVVSRMLARREHGSIDDVYWQTTIWISVLTFPIFVPCIAMPGTLALLVAGPGYVESSGVLVVLAIGDFLNAAAGPNTQALIAHARTRFVVWTTSAATLFGTLVAWLLVPALGALGAAAGVSAALVAQNALHHRGLRRHTAVGSPRGRYLGVYASQVAAVVLLLALDAWLHLPAPASGVAVIAATLALLRLHRGTMHLAAVVPELARVPWLGRFVLPGGAGVRTAADAVAPEQAPPP